MTSRTGRCLCGAVTYAFSGEMLWRAHCHCESCRRATASPFTTFFGVDKAGCRFDGVAPRRYRSSPGVVRLFCGRCGTPMAYESDRFPGEIHLYAATLDEHRGFTAERHVFDDERVTWVTLGDDLPRFPEGGE